MMLQTFRDLLRQRPFRPFRVVMSSGEAYEIRHPQMAFLTQTDIIVGVRELEEGIPEEFRICPLLHVTAIQPTSSATT